MKTIKSLLSVLMLFGLSIPPLAEAQSAERKKDDSVAYCHLKFPAIREDTLYSDRPVLKDPRDGDIIDFYGPCDYDPLGKEAVLQQRTDLVRERNHLEDNR
jgi:hypothetical protein